MKSRSQLCTSILFPTHCLYRIYIAELFHVAETHHVECYHIIVCLAQFHKLVCIWFYCVYYISATEILIYWYSWNIMNLFPSSELLSFTCFISISYHHVHIVSKSYFPCWSVKYIFDYNCLFMNCLNPFMCNTPCRLVLGLWPYILLLCWIV